MLPSQLQKKKAGIKRKLAPNDVPSRKKVKIQHNAPDDLPWKAVSRPREAGAGFADGILELEEVDDVEVIYEEINGAKVARFNVCRLKLPLRAEQIFTAHRL